MADDIYIEQHAVYDQHGGYVGEWHEVRLPFSQDGLQSEEARFRATMPELRRLRDFLTQYIDMYPKPYSTDRWKQEIARARIERPELFERIPE